MNSSQKQLWDAAKAAMQKSYSPYSHCRVGAAIRLANGKIYSGCNVENSSYGASNCAERVAIQNAQANEGGKIQIEEVLVITDATPPWPPCGMCRQVIAEFGFNSGKEALIHATNLAGDIKTLKLSELLPDAFTPDHLLKP